MLVGCGSIGWMGDVDGLSCGDSGFVLSHDSHADLRGEEIERWMNGWIARDCIVISIVNERADRDTRQRKQGYWILCRLVC